MLETFKDCQRITIKAGTSILTSPQGRFSSRNLSRVGIQILDLIRRKKEVVLVSSGAIALGMEVSGTRRRPEQMGRLQACAAIGQGKLMHAYERFFSRKGLHTAQLLLTRDGLEDRERFLKARQTLEELLKMGALPIVNENDTIATEEIGFGDNDVLSVHVAHLVHADFLMILSDVDGFYLKDGSRVRQVSSEEEIDRELVKHLKDTKTEKTVGGMKAKLEAARVAMRLGVPLLIVNGQWDKIITRALEGEDVGTLFLPEKEQKNARKKWIAFSARRRGSIIVDDGAYKALANEKRSLLARGIVKVRGDFKRGDVVELVTGENKVFGRGVVRYSSAELAQIAGKKSSEIQAVLGYKYEDEAIHRNDLVMWD
jgi:glutamate 5-kinase